MPIFPERRGRNESPKKGFCFTIANPEKMFDVAFKAGVDLADGDPELLEVVKSFERAGIETPGEVLWSFKVDSNLLWKIEVGLEGGYDEAKGQYIEVRAELYIEEGEVNLEKDVNKLAAAISAKGFEVNQELSPSDFLRLRIRGKKSQVPFFFYVDAYQDAEEEIEEGIGIHPLNPINYSLSLRKEKALKQLSDFQEIIIAVVQSLFSLKGQNPPNINLRLDI